MSFEKSISVFAELDDFVSKETRRIGLRIDRRVVQETPIDEGTAKRNWLVSIDQPNSAIFDADGLEMSTAEMVAIQQGAAAISSARVFTRIYIQNNLAYINRLNQGYSLQAPSMFVDKIIAEEAR